MRLRYFAWLRERTGRAEETVELPGEVRTVADLVAWLTARGPEFAHAFENAAAVRAAVDRVHAAPDTPLDGVSEVAFFPPMTGG